MLDRVQLLRGGNPLRMTQYDRLIYEKLQKGLGENHFLRSLTESSRKDCRSARHVQAGKMTGQGCARQRKGRKPLVAEQR